MKRETKEFQSVMYGDDAEVKEKRRFPMSVEVRT